MAQNDNDLRWDRAQISVWLAGVRKARLRQVAAQMAPGAGPKEAIDKAIELASSPLFVPRIGEFATSDAGQELVRLEEKLVGSLKLTESEIARRVERLDGSLALIAAQVGKMRAVIEAAVDAGDDEAALDTVGELTLPITEWLAQEAARLNISISRAAIVRATWKAKSRASDGLVSMVFSCELTAVDNVKIDRRHRLESAARFDSVPDSNPFSRLDAEKTLGFVCKSAQSSSWIVDAHPIDDAGNVGAVLGSMRL
ncbi:hypothetical protein [Caballeronia sp. GAFFF2]|uniref:hypothetical protein n=1 Tax=Caballeronia sp. GAFFF2 TaxID=2921741 RepID=UPI002028CE7B|nr:hypothetical protein [Caballeronia sp. GAFFF2]